MTRFILGVERPGEHSDSVNSMDDLVGVEDGVPDLFLACAGEKGKNNEKTSTKIKI